MGSDWPVKSRFRNVAGPSDRPIEMRSLGWVVAYGEKWTSPEASQELGRITPLTSAS
jgi:hypothetical protein